MAVEDLTGQHISSTYQRLLQISSSGEMANGTGSLYIPPLSVTASFAISASYALSSSHEIVKEISSSHADTASYVNTLNQDVFINGDLTLTGSLLASGSNSIINTQELQFNVDHIKSGHSTGRMFWDDDNKTITVDMQGSDVRLQLGQEEHVYAKNTSGEVINNGDAVRISGAVGANVTIQKAISSIKSFKDPTEQDQILGLATEQIADNKSGYITTFGAVRDLNTSAFNEGDILYLSNTSSGSYSSVRPPAPFFEARIGIVQVSNATEGIILVRPSEPIFLTDISQITGSGVIVGGTSYLCYDDNTEIIEFTNSFTGSFSGSFEGDGSGLTNIPTTPTASYALTASYVETAQTASYIISSSIDGISNYVRNDQTSSMTVLSSSFATTASYVLNSVSSSYSAFATTASYAENAGAGSGFPFNGDAVITGSLLVSGSEVNFQSASQLILPHTTIGPSTVTLGPNLGSLPAGGRTRVLLSSNTQTITVQLPAAPDGDDTYLGYEYTFDIAQIGGSNAKFVIQSGSSKISGVSYAANSTDALLNVDKLTMDTAAGLRQTDSIMIRSMGGNGWRVQSFTRLATAVSSST